MQEIRCKCSRLLAKAADDAKCAGLSIKCGKCGEIVTVHIEEPKESPETG